MSTQILFRQLASSIIAPVLARLDLGGAVALNLLLGTAAQESGLAAIEQYPSGPALGPYQMEPATHDDLLNNFLAYHLGLKSALSSFACPNLGAGQMAGNWYYATAVARLNYYRVEEPLPATPDPKLLGQYWKNHWNTPEGAGTVDEFTSNFQRHIGDPLNA